MKLKSNEQRIMDFLMEQETPIEMSAKVIGENILFEKAKLIRDKSYWNPSRQAVLGILEKLQKKGLVTLDYSNRTRPRIIVNSKLSK